MATYSITAKYYIDSVFKYSEVSSNSSPFVYGAKTYTWSNKASKKIYLYGRYYKKEYNASNNTYKDVLNSSATVYASVSYDTWSPVSVNVTTGNQTQNFYTTSDKGTTGAYGKKSLSIILAPFSDIDIETKPGYTPKYWYQKTANKNYSPGDTYTESINTNLWVTFYPVYEPNEYAVTLDVNGGTGGTTGVTATYDAAMPKITNLPTKTGYTFDGYYLNSVQYYKADGTSARTWNQTSNKTLTAKWTAIKYNISYTYNGGSGGTNKPSSANFDAVVQIDNPTRTGYTFAGWTYSGGNTSTAKYGSTESAVNTSWSNVNTKVTYKYFKNLSSTANATVTLYAQWSAASYTLKFDCNGGAKPGDGQPITPGDYTKFQRTMTYDTGNNNTMYPPTRTGYTCTGWFTATSGGTKIYNYVNTTTMTAVPNVSGWWDSNSKWIHTTNNSWLYAQWSINKYRLTANANGGSISTTSGWTGTGNTAYKDIIYNTEYGTLPTVNRTNYIFEGWWTDQTGGTQVSTTTKIGAATATIYAHWRAGTTITINHNDGTTNKTTLNMVYNGTANNKISKITRANYKFNGIYTSATGGTKIYDENGLAVKQTGYWDNSGTSAKWISDLETLTLYAQWLPNSYVYIDGWHEVKEIYIYNNGWKKTKNTKLYLNGWKERQ